MYCHELPDWPHYRWSHDRLAVQLASVRHEQGRLIGQMHGLGFPLQGEALLDTLTADVIKTSEIEGERLDKRQVRSSVARRLGIEMAGMQRAGRDVEGVVEMMLDATGKFDEPLTAERLFSWHAALFPTGRSGLGRITVGTWRDDRVGPMQVVSGSIGHERVHYEAPAANRLEREMAVFLDWFNGGPAMDPVLKAALAHLWFVTLHPFQDGNGRIARAIADMSLARSERSSRRFYSMSTQIRTERSAYYRILEKTQKGAMDVTGWMEWFLACLGRSIDASRIALATVLHKARIWEQLSGATLNGRQRLMLDRLFDGFRGKLTTSKWAAMAKCSQDSALRDILGLVEAGVLVRNDEGGRSTSYSLAP